MTFTRRNHAVTALHAVENSPTLARLAQLTRDSSNRLTAILPLVPPLLRDSLQRNFGATAEVVSYGGDHVQPPAGRQADLDAAVASIIRTGAGGCPGGLPSACSNSVCPG